MQLMDLFQMSSKKLRQAILVGVTRGMKYLHDHNIIHREFFKIKISDFSFSKSFKQGHSKSQSSHLGIYIWLQKSSRETHITGRQTFMRWAFSCFKL